MHELALCESVLRILRNEAATHHFQRVRTVRLELGAFCNASPEALDFCFKAVTHGTLADGARLELVQLSGQAWCMNCGETVTVSDRLDNCPQCGTYELQIAAGDDMRVCELEVE